MFRSMTKVCAKYRNKMCQSKISFLDESKPGWLEQERGSPAIRTWNPGFASARNETLQGKARKASWWERLHRGWPRPFSGMDRRFSMENCLASRGRDSPEQVRRFFRRKPPGESRLALTRTGLAIFHGKLLGESRPLSTTGPAVFHGKLPRACYVLNASSGRAFFNMRHISAKKCRPAKVSGSRS